MNQSTRTSIRALIRSWGSPRRVRIVFILFVFTALCGPTTIAAQSPASQTQEPAAPQGTESPSPGNYGRTPDTVIPYRNFRDPYLRFFQTPVKFLGTGRETILPTLPDTVRIGFFGPLESAPDADLGRAMLEGVTLAIEQANEANGYRGVPFELVVRQDSGLWGASSNEMVAFRYEDEVLAVIGSIDGANTHIALRVALKMHMPMINTATTDPTLTETNIPWLLRCMADDRQQGYALAYHIFKEIGIGKVLAFRVNDRFGRTGIGEFRDAARRLRHPLLAELRWDRGERDFSMQLDRIEALAPEAVVVWGNAADSAAVVKALRERFPSIRIFGCDRLASESFLKDAGEAAEGVVAAATYDPTRDNPRLEAFVDAYVRRFHHEPETFAAHAYDGANILIETIRKAGLNRVLIRDALYDYTQYAGVTGSILFDTTMNDVGPVHLATVEDGRFTYRVMKYDADRRTSLDVGVKPYRSLADTAPIARSPIRLDADHSIVRIGCFLPLDETGENVMKGVRQALDELQIKQPGEPRIEILVRDTRGVWGDEASKLVQLITEHNVRAIIGSTERRGTHLAEMLAAKMHFPIVSLCATDASITQIPLPWVFRLTSSEDPAVSPPPPTSSAYALGHDAATLLVDLIRDGAESRRELRDALAGIAWREGLTGTYRFDPLGNRLELPQNRLPEVQSEFHP